MTPRVYASPAERAYDFRLGAAVVVGVLAVEFAMVGWFGAVTVLYVSELHVRSTAELTLVLFFGINAIRRKWVALGGAAVFAALAVLWLLLEIVMGAMGVVG